MAENKEPEQAEGSKRITTDSAIATLTPTEGQPVRKAYVVKSKAGLFKNGKQYDAGEEIDLDEQTAASFLALDEIEEK